MSLKDIGKIGDILGSVGGFTSKLDVAKNLGGLDAFYKAAKVVEGLSASEAITKFQKFGLNSNLISDLIRAASEMNILTGTADETQDALKKMGATGAKGVSGLGAMFTGLKAVLAPIAPLLLGIAAGVAAVALEDLFTVDYGEAQEKAQASSAKFVEDDDKLKSLNSELATTKERIAELQALKAAGTISFAEEVELDGLQRTNNELERKIELQEKLRSSSARASVSDVKDALEKEEHSVARSIRFGDSKGEKSFKNSVGKVNDTDAIKEDITLYEEYSDKLIDCEERRGEILDKRQRAIDDGTAVSSTPYQKEIDELDREEKHYEESLRTLDGDMSKRAETLQADVDTLTRAGGTENLKLADDINEVLDSIANIGKADLSPIEKTQKSLDSFFSKSSSSGIKDYLTEIAKSGGDVASAMSGLGITLDDVDSGSVSKYFNDITKSAEEAATAAERVDGSLSGVATALESANGGDDFIKMGDYLKQSQQLLKQGLTGTDEFDSIEKMITSGTGQSYQDAYAGLQRYFTTDKNEKSEFFGQYTKKGIENFANDYQKVLEKTGKEFKSTGELARAFTDTLDKPISAQSLEAIMGRVSDYDGFEDMEEQFKNIVKSSEQLTEAKSSLSGLKEIYDSMDSGNDKERLKLKLDNWDSQIALAEEDLSKLPPEIVTQLKFEYNKAELEEANRLAREGSASSSASTKRDEYSGILGRNKQIISDTETYVGEEIVVAVRADKSNLDEALIDAQNELDALVAAGAEDSVIIEAQMEVDEAEQNYNDALMEMKEKGIIEITTESEPNTPEEIVVPAKAEVTSTDLSQLPPAMIEAIAKATGVDLSNAGTPILAAEVKAEGTVDTSGIPEALVDAILKANGIDLSKIEKPTIQANVEPTIMTPLNLIQEKLEVNASLNYTKGLQAPPDKQDAVVDYTWGMQDPPVSPQSAVVNYVLGSVAEPSGVTVKVNYDTSGSPNHVYNGTAHAQGSAFYYGSAFSEGSAMWQHYRNASNQAYAGGNWGLQQDENALINELGNEIVVRGGKWMTFNNGLPTFANLKKDDIVFNHRQSEELLAKGYVTSGHANIVGGGAKVDGTVGGKAFAEGTKEDEFKESFDGIDILLERIDAAFKKLKDSIDDFSENLDLQNSTTQNAIDTARRDIGTMQSAYNAYIEKANAVGLEDNWKTTVQNGDLKITEITDKDLKQRIDDYQDYYNKALSVSEEMADLQRELIELATQKLDNIDNYFSNRFDYNEDNGYETGIEELKSALDKYTNELNAQVNSGAIKMYSDEWYDAMSKISEYMDNIFDATISRIESVITNIDNASKNFNNAIDLKEARSEDPTRDDYTQIINNNNKQIGEVNKKRQKALADMAIYDVNSDKYKELADEISNCDDEIYGLLESNEELKDSIFEAEFTKPMEKLKTQYENLTNELDDLRGLMNDDAFIDPKGMLTADGAANIALIAQGMAAAKQMTADYTGALSKLNGALKSGLISQAEYDEQQNEILDSIRDSVGVTEDYKNELVDLYKKQMEAENDALHENIDTRKEALQKKKEYYDYDQKVKGQSKEINILKAQAAALSGVTNAAGQAKLKAIQDEIKNAENDLSETKKDHAYEIRVEGLDTMGDEMDEALEKTLEEITYNADKQQQIVQEMLNKVVSMYGDAYGKINDIIKDTGWVQGGEASDNNDKLGSQDGAQDIVNGANKPQSGVKPSDTVGDINVGGTPADNPKNDEIEEEIKIPIDITNRKVAQIKLTTNSVTIQEGQSASVGFTVRPTDAKNKAVKWSSSNTKVATVSGGKVVGISPGSASITCVADDDGGAQATCGVTVTKKPAPPAPPVQSGGGDGVARVGDKVTLNAGQRYYYDSWGKTPAGSKYAGVQGGVVIDSYSGAEYGGGARNHGGYGVHIKSADGKYGDLGWVRLDQLSGYAKGTTGVKEDQFARINELGTEMLTRSVRINGRDYTHLSTGDGVVPANITKNLMDFGVNPQRALSNSIGSLPNRTSNNQVIVNYDNLINIEGNATPETVFKLKDMMPEIVDGVTRSIMSDYHKCK